MVFFEQRGNVQKRLGASQRVSEPTGRYSPNDSDRKINVIEPEQSGKQRTRSVIKSAESFGYSFNPDGELPVSGSLVQQMEISTMTNEVITMTTDEFNERYKPIKNHLDGNASFDGCMYETYGEEMGHVLNVHETEPNRVWTVLDVDGRTIISNGLHYVNRLGYMITEVPFTGKFCEVIDEEEIEESDCRGEHQLPKESLSFGVDDLCECLECGFIGLVKLGADKCPECGRCGSLIDRKE